MDNLNWPLMGVYYGLLVWILKIMHVLVTVVPEFPNFRVLRVTQDF